MKKRKKINIIIQEDWIELMEPLSNEEFGELIRALSNYAITQEKPHIDNYKPLQQMALRYILPRIEENLQKYKEICKKREEYAKISHSKSDKNSTKGSISKQKQAKASKSKQKDALAAKDKDKDKDNDKSTNVDNIFTSSNDDVPKTDVSDSDSEPKKKSKAKKPEEYSVGYRCRKEFEKYYMQLYNEPYEWSAKEGSACKRLLKKLANSRKFHSKPTDDDSMVNAFCQFIKLINDQWIKDRLSVALIDSKFNEIVQSHSKKQFLTIDQRSNIGVHPHNDRDKWIGVTSENVFEGK